MDGGQPQPLWETKFYEGAPLYYSDHVPYSSTLFDLDNQRMVDVQNEGQQNPGHLPDVHVSGPKTWQHSDNVGSHHKQEDTSNMQGAYYVQENEYVYRQTERIQYPIPSHPNDQPNGHQLHRGVNSHGYPGDTTFQHIPSYMDHQQHASNPSMPHHQQGRFFGQKYPMGPYMNHPPPDFRKSDVKFQGAHAAMPSDVHPFSHHVNTGGPFAPDVPMQQEFQHFSKGKVEVPNVSVPLTEMKHKKFPNPVPSHYIPGSQDPTGQQEPRNPREMCPPIHPNEMSHMRLPTRPCPDNASVEPPSIKIQPPTQPQQTYREWQVTIRETTSTSESAAGHSVKCHKHCNCHDCVKAMVPRTRAMSPIPAGSPRRYSTTFPPSPEIYSTPKTDVTRMEPQPAARPNLKQEGGPAPVSVSAVQQVRVKQELTAKHQCVKYEEDTSVCQPACSNLKQEYAPAQPSHTEEPVSSASVLNRAFKDEEPSSTASPSKTPPHKTTPPTLETSDQVDKSVTEEKSITYTFIQPETLKPITVTVHPEKLEIKSDVGRGSEKAQNPDETVCPSTIKAPSVPSAFSPKPFFKQCDECPRKFTHSGEWETHKRGHKAKNDKEHQCEYCKKCYTSRNGYLQHRRKFHEYCLGCNTIFRRKVEYELHKEECDPDKPHVYRCQRCSFTSLSNKELANHLMEHSPGKEIHVCDKGVCWFREVEGDFSKHLLEHQPGGWYYNLTYPRISMAECKEIQKQKELCESQSKATPAEEKSASKSVENKPSSSETISEANPSEADASQPQNEQPHIATPKPATPSPKPSQNIQESNQEKFECVFCKQQYKSEIVFNAHMRYYHVKCKKCNKQFQSVKLLKQHNSIVNKENSSLCESGFVPYEQVFTCENCDQIFMDEKVFGEHLSKHENVKPRENPQPHFPTTPKNQASDTKEAVRDDRQPLTAVRACNLCKRKYTSRAGLENHLKYNHVKCVKCNKQFQNQHYLNMHMRSSKLVGGDGCEEGYVPVEEVHNCQVCNEVFAHAESIDNTFKEWRTSGSLKCPQCQSTVVPESNPNTESPKKETGGTKRKRDDVTPERNTSFQSPSAKRPRPTFHIHRLTALEMEVTQELKKRGYARCLVCGVIGKENDLEEHLSRCEKL